MQAHVPLIPKSMLLTADTPLLPNAVATSHVWVVSMWNVANQNYRTEFAVSVKCIPRFEDLVQKKKKNVKYLISFLKILKYFKILKWLYVELIIFWIFGIK